MEEKENCKVYRRKCNYCEKVISSLSEQQCVYNFRLHEEACRKKYLKNMKGGENGIQKEEESCRTQS